jgi:mono/diheme cytochrome c family protein
MISTSRRQIAMLCQAGWMHGGCPLWLLSLLLPCLAEAAPKAKATVESRAMEILQGNCFNCHNEEKKKGGLSLLTPESALRGSENGPVIKPGEPAASQIIRVLGPAADPHMPPKKQLSPDEIRTMERWVKAGAKWDASALLAAEERMQPVDIEGLPQAFHPVSCLALAPDDARLAVARGGRLAILDVRGTNFPILAQCLAHPEGVQSLAWNSNGTVLVSGGFRRIILWDASSLERQRELTNGIVGRVTALAFAQEDQTVIAADSVVAQRGFIRVMEADTGKVKASWAAHADSIYAMALSPDGHRIATAGGDKLIKVWDLETRKEVSRLEGHGGAVLGIAFNTNATQLVSAGADKEVKVWNIETREKIISLGRHSSPLTATVWLTNDSAVLVANESGVVLRYTDLKAHSGEQSSNGGNERKMGEAGEMLLSLAATRDGKTLFAGSHEGNLNIWRRDSKLDVKLGPDGQAAGSPATASTNASSPTTMRRQANRNARATAPVSFVRDVLPVLSKAGCNAGACHAKPEGQNGFKLSVFSYDPQADYAEMVREARGRRVFPAAPAESLILKKPTLTIPHEGGERFKRGSPEYELVARWIREGMAFQLPDEPTLVRIEVTPAERRYRKGASQRLQVTAHYTDKSVRDVTHLASFVSNEKEMATVDEQGRVTVGRLTGQGVVVARYMGFVADAKITVPADKLLSPAKYAALPVHNFIDEHAYAHFKKLGLFPSMPCSDSEFLRRASLDTIGMLPTVGEARDFLGATDTNRADSIGALGKRRLLIDRLLQHPAYADYWANKFADLLRPNPDRVGVKSVFTLDQWLRESFRENKPYDRFVQEILAAEGSNHREGPAVVYRDRREPADLTTMFSQLFLGVRLECARCHHHPNEKWSQDDFYRLAAYFGPVKQKGAGLSPPISAGTETFYFAPGGGVKHPVSGAVMTPKPPDGDVPNLKESDDPRVALVEWLTRADNPFFARAIVNRVWANFFGRGLVEPVDDFRISNPCVNPPLLDALARDFVQHGCDLKHLMRTIMESRLYQLSSEPNATNLADTRNFSRSYRRRLPAEVLLDAVNDVTGVPDTGTAFAPGARSTQMWSYKIESQFLDAFGRPNSSSDCPCERELRTSVVQSLHLMNSKNIQAKLANDKGRAHELAASDRSPTEIVTELYLATLSRYPKSEELRAASAPFGAEGATRQAAAEDVLWALLNSAEFVFNH